MGALPRSVQVGIPKDQLAAFRRAHGIRWLAIIGSVLRSDFETDSDVDLLVEIDPDCIPGLLRMAGMELEFSDQFGGRNVDLRTSEDLSRYFRDALLKEAGVQYVRGR